MFLLHQEGTGKVDASDLEGRIGCDSSCWQLTHLLCLVLGSNPSADDTRSAYSPGESPSSYHVGHRTYMGKE